MGGEPVQDLILELLRGCTHGSAMIGVGNLPERGARIVSVDQARVTYWNVAIGLSVNEKYGNGAGIDGFVWRDSLHVEVVFPAGAKKCGLDYRTKQSLSDPRSKMKRLAHPVVGDFAKVGERRFGHDGTEIGFHGKRLQELSGAHGLAKTIDAMWMVRRREPVEPFENVTAFK